ncbi:MAG TPA: site-specific integrase [Acidimicrobiales bacterium]|nr:site-specific integrase [Acidimicrobiales bacterium]
MANVEKRYGNYRVRYEDPFGRRRSETFTRKGDAERFLRETRVAIDNARWLDPNGEKITLAEWADDFMSLARRLSPTTQQTYRRDLDKYILTRFGAYTIGRLPSDEIENWLMDEVESGTAPSSVHRHYRTLRRMLQVAIEKEKLLLKPCDRVTPPRVPRAEMVFLSWNEAINLVEAHSERYRALVYLAIDSGMRWGELIGLRRANVDVQRQKVRVTEQLIRMGAGEWLRKEPKTSGSVRSVTISEFTATVLTDHLSHFAGPGSDGLVFANQAGHPLISSSFLTHHFKPARDSLGLSCRFHDLRHTSVALAIASGAHPKAIQARMGHSAINVTLDRYGHLFPELDEAIAVSFDAQFVAVHAIRSGNVVHATFGNA